MTEQPNQLPADRQRPAAVCVLGMHRSGTSALARVINLLGVDLGHDLMPERHDNPRGFWEHRAILEVHENLLDEFGSSFDDFFPLPAGWHLDPKTAPLRQQLIEIVRRDFAGGKLWGFKDPRTCRLLPMWHDIFAAVGADSRFVLVVRHPDEIAGSLASRNGYSYNKSLLLTVTHLLEAEYHTRGRPRVVVSYDRLMSDWRGTLRRVAAALQLTWPVEMDAIAGQVGEFLDPSLRHHEARSRGPENPDADTAAVQWMTQLHQMLLAAEQDGAAMDTGLVDRLRGEFDAQRRRLGTWRDPHSLDRKHMQLQAFLRQEGQLLRGELDRHAKALEESRQWVAEITRNNQRLGDELQQRDRELRDLRQWAGKLNQDRQWFEKQATTALEQLRLRDAATAELKTWVEKLQTDQQWIEQQWKATQEELKSRDAVVGELRAWTSELEKGKTWLSQQREELEKSLRQRDELIARLQSQEIQP